MEEENTKPRKHNATQGVAQALVRQGHHQFGLQRAWLHLVIGLGLGAAFSAIYGASIPTPKVKGLAFLGVSPRPSTHYAPLKARSFAGRQRQRTRGAWSAWKVTLWDSVCTVLSLQTKSPITFTIARKPSVDKAFLLLDDESHVPPHRLYIHGLDSRTHDRRAVPGIRLKT